MKQTIGQEPIGAELKKYIYNWSAYHLIDKCTKYFEEEEQHYLLNYVLNEDIRRKEDHCLNIIYDNFKDLQEVSIIGCRFPYNYVYNLNEKYYCKFNLIDFHPCFERWSKTVMSFADCEYYRMRPLFDDLNSIIENSNLIIFPETEFLIPFKHLNYDLSNKNVLYVNQQLNVDRINDNIVYSELEMEQMCNVFSSLKGRINSTSYYLLKLT